MQAQVPRPFKKLIPNANGHLFAIAQDGTAWVMYAGTKEWTQILPLPPLEYRVEAITM